MQCPAVRGAALPALARHGEDDNVAFAVQQLGHQLTTQGARIVVVGAYKEQTLAVGRIGIERQDRDAGLNRPCHAAQLLDQTSIEEARTAMMERRIRHLPVVDGEGRLLGLISIGDLNAFEAASREETIFWLHEYLHGRV